MTVAEKIASQLELVNGGDLHKDPDNTIREILQNHALDITRKGFQESDPVRYLFIDGSSIEILPSGWTVNSPQQGLASNSDYRAH